MADYLKQTDLFEVEVVYMDTLWPGIKYNSDRSTPLTGYLKQFPAHNPLPISDDPAKASRFEIDFEVYDLVISNLGANTPDWPESTKRNFERYMQQGGGLVIVHAANNAWGDWTAFNKMIGLGAWGARDSTSGPFVYYDNQGTIQADSTQGVCGSHGQEHEFVLTTRAPDHPIMRGLPASWLHAKDELYDRMRGPFDHTTILATAFSDTAINEQPWEPALKGSGKHVPMLLAIDYGQGRTFHTTLGHFDYSLECVGFITTFTRGAEWAATGTVTQRVPGDFPTARQTSSRSWRSTDP